MSIDKIEVCFTTGYKDEYVVQSTGFSDLYTDPFVDKVVSHSNTPSTPSAPSKQILGVDMINITFPTGYSDEYIAQNTGFSDLYTDPFADKIVSHSNTPSTPSSPGKQILGIDMISVTFPTGYKDEYLPQSTIFIDEYGLSC